MFRLAPSFALVFAFSGLAWGAESATDDKSVGKTTMLQDGTILVGVPGPGPDSRAQAVLEVQPGDTNYQQIIDHVGGLKPGETKPIPPWPDPPPPLKDEPVPAEPPPGA